MTHVDPGLQPERTEMAWRRTSLSVAMGSLLAMRLLPQTLGHGAWLVVGVVGLCVSTVLWVGARRRYRATVLMLRSGGERGIMPDGLQLAGLAVVAMSGALCALVILLIMAFRGLP